MVATYENEPRGPEFDRPPSSRGDEIFDDGFYENLRLGHDLRFMLVCVGGGAVRVGREIARRHLRYLETVAINCDPHVQEVEEFDRRVYLGPESGTDSDTGGSVPFGASLARAAAPALERIFDGATFVTVIGSLGGGSGTGALPFVLDAAARGAEVLSVFVLKPFACEGERRAVAERALGRLHFVESFVEKRQRGVATLTVLDNESLVHQRPSIPFNRLNSHWGREIAGHIERAFIAPAETFLGPGRSAGPVSELEVVARPLPPDPHRLEPIDGPGAPPIAPSFAPGFGGEAEVTFEVELPFPGPPAA